MIANGVRPNSGKSQNKTMRKDKHFVTLQDKFFKTNLEITDSEHQKFLFGPLLACIFKISLKSLTLNKGIPATTFSAVIML